MAERFSSFDDNISEAEFSYPRPKSLKPSTVLTCSHCKKKFSPSVAENFYWYDAIHETRHDFIVNCTFCGSRELLNPNAKIQTNPIDGGDNPFSGEETLPPKRPIWSIIIIITLAFAILIATALIKFNGGTSEPTDSTNNSNSDATSAQAGIAETSHSIMDLILPDTDETQKSELPEETKTVYQDTTDPNLGNSYINISEGGMMVWVDDRWLYTNPADGNRIYAMDKYLENQYKVCDIPAYYLSYYDGIVYFAAVAGTQCIYSMNPDGSNVTQLNNLPTYESKVVNGLIYYEDSTLKDKNVSYSGKYDLWRYNIATGENTLVADGVVFYCCIGQEHIYFLDTQDAYHLYQIDLDGSHKKLLSEEHNKVLCYQDGILYRSVKDGGVYAYEEATQREWKISDLNVGSLNVSGEWMYFAHLDNEKYLYKQRLDGSELTKLSSKPAIMINVCGNLICYQNPDDKKHYWMETDSGKSIEVQ